MNKNASVGIPMKKICGRLTRILCTCAVFVSLTGAAYAQSAPVTLDRKKAPVREILNEIEQQTDYLFVYSSEQVDFSVSVTAHDEPVQTVLRRIFEGTPIRFTLEGKHIVLRRQPQTAANAAAASPAKQTVTGTVTDTAGKPVVGATVLVKGGTVGTTTDVDGRFSLMIPAGSPLEVSFLGYARQEIATAGRTSLDIRLEEDAATLDEVVVVGYGTMKRRNLVGAVDQVDSRVIGDRSNGNLARSLQGELPGLNISFSDSKPSRSASFNVRGETSIGAGGNALVLIDGVEGSMDAINPQDVESVSVLKDASSTAVYGARGAFGVVLVTTKSPKAGCPRDQLQRFGHLQPPHGDSRRHHRRPDVGSTGGRIRTTVITTARRPCSASYPQGRCPDSEAIYPELIRRQADPSLSRTTTLEGDSMFGWAYMEVHRLAGPVLQGLEPLARAQPLDFGRQRECRLLCVGPFLRHGRYLPRRRRILQEIRSACQGFAEIRPWFKVTNNTSLAIIDQHEPKHSRNNFAVQRAINHAAMPLSPVKNPDGSWTTAAAISGYAAFSEGTSYRNNDYVYFRNKLSADIDIVKEVLKVQADYSYNYTTRKRIDVQNPVKYSKKPGVYLLESESAGASLSQVDYDTRYQAANAYLTYTPNLGADHDLTVLAGWNIEDQVYKTLTVSRTGFVTPNKPSFSLMNGVAENPRRRAETPGRTSAPSTASITATRGSIWSR